MQYIHIKNLEKYNPGYTDRNLIWCKIYFSMINASYEFENMDDIDKWRLIALIMLEIQMKKPIPLDEKWLMIKISNNKRPISLTLKTLHNFLDIVTNGEENLYRREDKIREDKRRIEKEFDTQKEFNLLINKYPNNDGKKKALSYFVKTVKTKDDLTNINKALDNYLESKNVKEGFVKNASTWFNNWQDWIEVKGGKDAIDSKIFRDQ